MSSSTVRYGGGSATVVQYWFTGWTYNATAGSRVRLTSDLVNGSIVCFDPLAYANRATLPAGMRINPNRDTNPFVQYAGNVTQCATAIIGLFAGVVVNLPGGKRVGSKLADFGGYKDGCWIDVAVGPANQIDALVLGDCSSTLYDSLLSPVNGQWYASPVAVGTNGANLPNVIAKPLAPANFASATLTPVRLLGNHAAL